MADNPQLVVALSARIDKFEKDLKEAGLIAGREVASIEGKLGNIGAGKDLLGGVAGGLVGGLVSQLPGLIAKAEDGFAKLQDVIVKLFPTAFPQFEQMNTLVKTHGEIVAGLKDSYGEAAKGIREFSRESVAVLEARQSIAVLDLEVNLQRLTQTMTDMSVRALPSLADMEQGIIGLGTATIEVVGKFKPFESAIRSLFDGFVAGTPDIRAFREAVAAIARENQSSVTVQLLAKELLALTTDANNAQRALDAIAASMRQVGLDAQNAAAQGTAFRDAMTKLGRVAPTPVSSREAAKIEHDAAMLAASGTDERRAAMVAYQAALKRVNEEEKRRAPAAPSEGISSLERFDDQFSRHLGLLKAETEAVGKTVAQREELRAIALVEEAARRDGLTKEQAMTAERQKQIEQAGRLKQDVVERQAALAELNSASKEFGSTLADGFKGLVLEGKKFDEVLKSITNRLTSKAIDKAFDLLFAPSAGSSSSIFTKLLQGALSGKAAGGPVSGGTPYMVGEKGPELFVPNRSGIIVPNSATRGMGGGTVKQTVVVNDYSGQAKVRQTNSTEGGGVEVFVPAIEQMLAVGVSRGRGALSKSVDARRRGTNLYG